MRQDTVLDYCSDHLEHFFREFPKAQQRLLMLDYDGTLAPFHVRREMAVPYAGIAEILGRIQQAGHTRLVLVSGRVAQEVLDLLPLPEPVEVWGSHGWERRLADGTHLEFEIPETAAQTLAMINARLNDSLRPNLEAKPGCLALHWRDISQDHQQQLAEVAQNAWHEFATGFDLKLVEFDGGIEFRVNGRNKGTSVRTLLDETEATAMAAYLGDDQTDEDAFEALGERGLSVLVRNQPRPTAARVWIRPPEELIYFLHRWHNLATPCN
jgi:trehalose-phosphatase